MIDAATPTCNRRRHERVALPAMYTHVEVRPNRTVEAVAALEGHAYDISQSGVRIELDEPLAPGEAVDVSLDLAGGDCRLLATAEVVWVNDDSDDPGPRRMALQFAAFDSEADRARLLRYLACGRRLAA